MAVGLVGCGGSELGRPDEPIKVAMSSFSVPPGAEVYKCQDFVNPFGGVDTDIQMMESRMSQGSHHFILFYQDNVHTTSELTDCSGTEFELPSPFVTQTPNDQLVFPDGIAARLAGSTGLRLQVHYLNSSTDFLSVEVEVELHPAKAGSVTAHAGLLTAIQGNIYVPPQSETTIPAVCPIPYDVNILRAQGHMHKHGTYLEANLDGKHFYSTESWDHPDQRIFDPPLHAPQGTRLDFQCTYTNDGPTTLTFGESADTNEMCVMLLNYYPAPLAAAQSDFSCSLN
jgi:hypothetical protein